MNKTSFFFLLCLNLLISTTCYAVKNVAGEITPVVGYRQDNIKWTLNNKASGQWKNANFIEYGLKGKGLYRDRYVLVYDVTIGNLVSGTYRDNHYLNPASSSNTSAEKAWSIAFRPNIGLGYKFKPTRYFNLVPQLGFIYDLLYLKTKTAASGPISAFKDTIQWYGPWLGVDTSTKLTRRWTLDVGGIYGLAFYNNSGNWQMPSSQTQNKMNQKGTGQTVSGRVRLQYEVVKSVNIGGEADIAWKQVSSGNDTRSYPDTDTRIKSKLSKITGSTWGAHLVLTKAF